MSIRRWQLIIFDFNLSGMTQMYTTQLIEKGFTGSDS